MKHKYLKAQKLAGCLPMATAEIWNRMPEELKERLTAKEISLVMQAMNTSYHAGRKSTGAEKIDTDCVWIDDIGMMEIKEDGAEYETVTETDTSRGYTCTIHRQVKIKSGKLIGEIIQ